MFTRESAVVGIFGGAVSLAGSGMNFGENGVFFQFWGCDPGFSCGSKVAEVRFGQVNFTWKA